MITSVSPAQLTAAEAQELIASAETLLIAGTHPTLSLPFVREQDSTGSPLLVSHFERRRNALTQLIQSEAELRVVGTYGSYYIDPELIPRKTHAPTEVKIVFEFRGRGTLLHRPVEQTLAMLQKVTAAKQKRYQIETSFTVAELPEHYKAELLPHIQEFAVQPAEFYIGRVMALQHLSPDERSIVINRLRNLGRSDARQAILLLEQFGERA